MRTAAEQYQTAALDIIGGGAARKTVSEEHKRADKAVHDFMKKPYVCFGRDDSAE